MRNATKEYIEFFGLYETITNRLDQLFGAFSASMPDSKSDFEKLRSGMDIQSLISEIGLILESIFSQEELDEIVVLYRKHPVLLKLMSSNEKIFELENQASERMVQSAIERMPFVVNSGAC